MTETNGRRLQTIDKTLAIVNELQARDGARITELAEDLDMAPSSVHSHLNTLRSNGYVVKEGQQYTLGLMFLNRGGFVRRRKEEYEEVFAVIEKLAEETNERAQFIVEEHGHGVYLHTATGDHAVQVDARIGKLSHLHASAAGKAILASLPPERVDEIVDLRSLSAVTDNTITDRDALDDELDRITNRGFSFNKEESIPGLRAVGVSVKGSDDEVLGGISVSGPTNRMKGEWFENEIPDLLLGHANELELNFAYQ